MQSIWEDTQAENERYTTQTFEPHAHYDTVIVGAGLTGLTTALLLARSGQAVAVLEARRIGAVTTGKSTAKLSLLHGGALGEIHAHTSDAVLRAYVEGNTEGQQWLLRYLDEHGVDVQRQDAYTYAVTPEGEQAVTQDLKACKAAGLEVSLENDTGLPFATRSAIRLADQAQFNPMHVLHALTEDVRKHGGTIVEGVRVRGVDSGKPCTVNTSSGEVTADHVVLATGIPILDRGLYFTKLKPKRSYVTAFRMPQGEPVLDGMHLSLDSPTRSLRTAPVDDAEWLLVGGNGHTVGREASPQSQIDDLAAWTRRYFPDAELTHSWSAQDYVSMNRIPFVGKLPRGGGKISIATGYNKWGMTNAVAAALNLAAELLGGDMQWANTMHHRVTRPHNIASAIAFNAEVGAHLTSGWVQAELQTLPERELTEGEGLVAREGATPIAVSKVEGRVCKLSAVCPHLGGILSWNDAERSWDCPLHGSRFDADGRLLEGPATDDLEHID